MIVDGHAFVELLLISALRLVDIAQHSLEAKVFVTSIAVSFQHWMAFSEDLDKTSPVFLDPKDIVLFSCVVFLKSAVKGESA